MPEKYVSDWRIKKVGGSLRLRNVSLKDRYARGKINLQPQGPQGRSSNPVFGGMLLKAGGRSSNDYFSGGKYGKTHSFRQKGPSEDGRCKQEVANPAGGHCPRIGLYESKDFQKDYVRED
jgi:hypothetical protein